MFTQTLSPRREEHRFRSPGMFAPSFPLFGMGVDCSGTELGLSRLFISLFSEL
jgi:hypothetical protein